MDGETDPQPQASDSTQDTPVPAPAPQENQEVLRHDESNAAENGPNITVNLPPDRVRAVEILQVVINGALAVIGVAAICIYGGQLRVMQGQLTEMQKQTNLTHQQIAGTDAAYIFSDVVTTGDEGTANAAVFARFMNRGKVIAKHVQGSIVVSLESFPSGKVIRSATKEFSKDQLRPTDDGIFERIEGFLGPNMGMLDRNQATVVVEARFSYDNGFGDTIRDSSCKAYFVRHDRQSVSERTWGDCDAVKVILQEENEAKRKRNPN